MEDKYSLSLQTVNWLSLPFGLLMLGGGLALYARRHGSLLLALRSEQLMLVLAAMLPAIVLHEAIHAGTARLFGAAARFGLDRRTWTPYVHVQAPLRVWQYRWQVSMPTLLLGLLPLLVGWLSGRAGLYLFGLVMCAAGLGDGFILWRLRKAPADHWALDHPTRAGCRVFPQRPEPDESE